MTTSPEMSWPRASTTFSDSLSTTSWPRSSSSTSSSGCNATRILRPALNTSTVPSSLAARKVPYADGGIVSFSTSSRSAPMCSRASRRVADSFSFWETAWASWPLVSSRRSSSVRTRFGASWRRRRSTTTSSSRRLHLLLQIADLALVLSEASLVLGGHARPPPTRRAPALVAAPYTRRLASLGTLGPIIYPTSA